MKTPATDSRVVVTREAALVRIRMDNGSGHNQLDAAVSPALTEAFSTVGEHPESRVVMLEGAPHSFCVGGSPELMRSDASKRMDLWTELLLAVLRCPLPVVAAAQGPALGGGVLLAAAADVRVLSDTSRYAANFLIHGFAPVGGPLLPAAFGQALGAEMILTGRSYQGSELARRGAGIAVVPHAQVPQEAGRMAARIAQAPRPVLELAKRQSSARLRAEVEAGLAEEVDAHLAAAATGEMRRRVAMLSAGSWPVGAGGEAR